MQTSIQRSKSFKALSMAQPIRKDIQQTLNQLELEKRRFLANQRQEQLLKQQVQEKRKQLNSLKKQSTKVQIDDKRATQTSTKLKNTDRAYEAILGSIQQIKQEIDSTRKRITKYKKVNQIAEEQQKNLVNEIDKIIDRIVEKQKQNEELKSAIVNYRDVNLKNSNQFKKSYMNLAKSSFKDENERRKYAVSTRTFLNEEKRQSRIVHYDKISDTLRSSGIPTNEGRADILADSIPIAKARVNVMIHRNKQKIKIAENYMKFGQGLQQMFKIMKQYKGRDDVDYLSEEFVKKQKQIQKLGQYIGKLQYRIVTSKRILNKKLSSDVELEENLKIDNQNQSQKHYKQMSLIVKQDIQDLKAQNLKMNEWMKKIAEILCPLAQDDDFSRGNAVNLMGKLQNRLNINRANITQKKQQSPIKQAMAPGVESEDHHQKYAELLSYQKMKQYADEYIKNKKAV